MKNPANYHNEAHCLWVEPSVENAHPKTRRDICLFQIDTFYCLSSSENEASADVPQQRSCNDKRQTALFYVFWSKLSCTPPRHCRLTRVSNGYIMELCSISYLTERGVLKIHPALSQMFYASFHEYRVPIPLMRHDRQRHDVQGHIGGGYQHSVQSVFPRLTMDIPESLNDSAKVMLIKHYVVVKLLSNCPATYHAQMRR